jgi:hypothetical protein
MAQNAYNIIFKKRLQPVGRPSTSIFSGANRSHSQGHCPEIRSAITFPEQTRSTGNINTMILSVFRSKPVQKTSSGTFVLLFKDTKAVWQEKSHQ